jgi:hypothetical protein
MNRRSWVAFAWRAARRASADRSRGTARGAVSTISDIPPSPSLRQENEDRIISEFSQDNVAFSSAAFGLQKALQHTKQ